MEKIIELENISKYYYIGKEKLQVLKNVNLTVKNGDFLAITGESGSGKSTLMNILGFLDTPDTGNYTFNGKKSKNSRSCRAFSPRFYNGRKRQMGNC